MEMQRQKNLRCSHLIGKVVLEKNWKDKHAVLTDPYWERWNVQEPEKYEHLQEKTSIEFIWQKATLYIPSSEQKTHSFHEQSQWFCEQRSWYRILFGIADLVWALRPLVSMLSDPAGVGHVEKLT